jgi:hypothetical protein
MATLQNLLDDLNDRLNDAGNQQAPEATKIRAINHGIRATWPRLYRTARDSTLAIIDDQWEYEIPAAISSNTKLLAVEVESELGSARFYPVQNYRVVPGLTDPILVFEDPSLPAEVGSLIRLTVARQLTELALVADTYDGPSGTEELPVLYALGQIMSRRLDDRIDHRRYPSTSGTNGVTPDTIMTASQFAYAQFELLLERFTMPLPVETAG